MKTVMWAVSIVALVLAGPVGAGAVGAQGTPKPSDKTLDNRIEQRIKADASLKKFDVDVSVTNHVATLTGAVATATERTRAAQLANINGISRVDNQIVVDASAARKTETAGTAGTVKEKTKEGVEKTKDGVEKVGEKTKEGLSKTGEVITDAWITSRVHTRFIGEDLLKDSHIDVDTKDHVVTLNGTVMSTAGRAKAVEIAKNTEDVHQVIDRLTIGPKR